MTCGPYRLDTVILQDCIEGMRALPEDCVDVAIADPPYNASKGGTWTWDNSVALPGSGGDCAKVDAAWDDMTLAEYVAFTLTWIRAPDRVDRPTVPQWAPGPGFYFPSCRPDDS